MPESLIDASDFDLARLSALKEYSLLEHEVCLLLKSVLEIDYSQSAAIFYQITNTRTRYAIINSLLAIRKEGLWRAWTGVEKWLGPCDTARNHLIHWFEDEISVVKFEGPIETAIVSVKQSARLKNATSGQNLTFGTR